MFVLRHIKRCILSFLFQNPHCKLEIRLFDSKLVLLGIVSICPGNLLLFITYFVQPTAEL